MIENLFDDGMVETIENAYSLCQRNF